MSNLLCFGMGYCAKALAKRLKGGGWTVVGTARSAESQRTLISEGFQVVPLPLIFQSPELKTGPIHVLVSAPPSSEGDPILGAFDAELAARASNTKWIGYLSTTGVYGDAKGEWVDEQSPLNAATERALNRVRAERQWLTWGRIHHVPVQIFRLAGIYGPGRNQLETLRSGTARRIEKPGQVFSRIHVDDVATVLEASLAHPSSGQIYNVCDDEPCAPQIVIEYAASLLGIPPPSLEQFEEASPTLSPMTASFYSESKRVRNDRIKTDLGVKLQFPTFREGLRALHRETISVKRPSHKDS
jgi:nucleoside-diphosphate-sugar epimerase